MLNRQVFCNGCEAIALSKQTELITILNFRQFSGYTSQCHISTNTRETVRRQTMHQFIQMGLVVENPD
jgi:hypothetical protein